MRLPRRHLIRFASLSALSGMMPRAAFATLPALPRRRLVFILLRGAMDGLGAVPPVGDADYAAAHGALAIPSPGTPEGALPLDARFGLHPALAPVHGLFGAGELLIVHAMASPYRQRSHFDAQNLLENGSPHPHGVSTGWLNRALALAGGGAWSAIAVGQQIPLVLQGAAPVANWQPAAEMPAGDSLLLAARQMYATDPAMAAALDQGLRTEGMIGRVVGGARNAAPRRAFAQLADATGRIMAAPDGPNIAVLEIEGWDTHVGQGAARGRLATVLGGFAQGVANLKSALGERWADTAIVAVTEFGRTVGANGTGGTDHGTGTAGFVAGGAVRGGRVLADWPGLASAALLDGRDLAPTTDIRALLKGVLGEHLRLTDRDLSGTVFPGSSGVRPIAGLLRA